VVGFIDKPVGCKIDSYELGVVVISHSIVLTVD